MAVKTREPVRKIIVRFWAHAVERTEAEIEELKAHGLFVRDAGPDDQLAPHAAVTVSAPLPAPAAAAPPQLPAAAPTPASAPVTPKEKTTQ